jgi:hypothetical protein
MTTIAPMMTTTAPMMMSFKYFGGHRNCVASRNYTAQVLQEWAAPDAQFERLVLDNCTWTNVRGISQNTWTLTHVHRVFSVGPHMV